jgi:hypothetical protein
MSDTDEFVLLAERYEGLPVLKPDRARGLQARYPDANKLIEENAAVRVASAFRHELKAAPRPPPVRYHDTTHDCQSIEASQGWGGLRTFVASD